MPTHNWTLFVAALVPLFTGFIWYHPKVFGKKWMTAAEMNEEKMKGANMGVIFGITYLLSLFAAAALRSIVVHQVTTVDFLNSQPGAGDPNSEPAMMLKSYIELFWNRYRSFGHGVVHGGLAGIMLALPVLGINALFERKGFKYIAINAGFWIVTLALMGGVICQWL